MTIRLHNQKPAVLYPSGFNVLPLIKPTDPVDAYIDQIEQHLKTHYVDPVYVPINATHPVRVTDSTTGTDIDADALLQSILYAWGSPTLDVNLREQLAEIYRQAIQYHAPNDWYFEEQLGVEALTRLKLPLPSTKSGRVVKYSASVDLIPSAKGFLGTPDDLNAMTWFANLTGYLHERHQKNFMLVTVQTADAWNDVKTSLNAFIQAWTATTPLPPATTQIVNDLMNIDLSKDLSTCLFLPGGGAKNPAERDPLSFTRMLSYVLAHAEQTMTPGTVTSQPLDLFQMYLPENIIVLNLENYAHANPADIKKDWDDIEKALTAKRNLNFTSMKRLATAKQVAASMNSGNANANNSANAAGKPLERRALGRGGFSKKPVTAKNMLALMARVIKSQITSKQTENVYTTVKRSFARPNRRQPDNIDLQGIIKTTKYRPDIHIYLDTSGSISESMFRDAVNSLIHLTKFIDCNLYFTSFSDKISQTTLIVTRNRSRKDIYRDILAVPKVGGGTDFEQVWRKIDVIDEMNAKTGKSHQINFVITDFGYHLSNGFRWSKEQASLKHTYYVPVSVSKDEWRWVKDMATNFAKEMKTAGDHGIRRRMLL